MYKGQLKDTHLLVVLYRAMDSCLYYISDFHICVSQSMKSWLQTNFHIKSHVVYDKPPMIFDKDKFTLLEKHALLIKLKFMENELFYSSPEPNINEEVSIQTKRVLEGDTEIIRHDRTTKVKLKNRRSESISYRDDRATAMIITSTSWTPDEDISILFKAIKEMDEHMSSELKALVVITGKGPLLSSFLPTMEELNQQLNHCAIRSVWLEPEEYPLLMSCADIGVCLHTSSSGLDLPMKVISVLYSIYFASYIIEW